MPIDATILQQLHNNDAGLTYLNNENLIDANILALCAAFKTNTSLNVLNLKYNKIGDLAQKTVNAKIEVNFLQAFSYAASSTASVSSGVI